MFKRSCIDTGKWSAKFRQLKLLDCPERTLFGPHQPVMRQLMIGCIKLQIDFSPWQFILPKYFNLSAFHSVLYPRGSLNNDPYIISANYYYLLAFSLPRIPARCSWQWECEESIKLILSAWLNERTSGLANQKTYCSLLKFRETWSKYTGYEFLNKNDFAVLQLKKTFFAL